MWITGRKGERYPSSCSAGWVLMVSPSGGAELVDLGVRDCCRVLCHAPNGMRRCSPALRATSGNGRGTHSEQGRERFALMVAKIAEHYLAHLNQLARTVAVATRRNASTAASRGHE